MTYRTHLVPMMSVCHLMDRGGNYSFLECTGFRISRNISGFLRILWIFLGFFGTFQDFWGFFRILCNFSGFFGIFQNFMGFFKEKRTRFFKNNLPLGMIDCRTNRRKGKQTLTRLIWLTTSLKIYSGDDSIYGFIWTDRHERGRG